MSDHSGDLRKASRRRLDPTGNAPALALAVAAGLHLAAVPDHAGQGSAVAGFFLATAVLQLAAAWLVALARLGVKARLGIAAGNLALIALWTWSRVAGLPFGTHPGPEAVSLLDGLAVAAEIIAVAGLCSSRATTRDRRRTGVAPGAALLTIMVLTGAGAVQWLPASHASQHVHPTTQPVHVAPPPEDDHGATAVTPSPCATGCETQPGDGEASHDATPHTHP